jgi:hypothetical protein
MRRRMSAEERRVKQAIIHACNARAELAHRQATASLVAELAAQGKTLDDYFSETMPNIDHLFPSPADLAAMLEEIAPSPEKLEAQLAELAKYNDAPIFPAEPPAATPAAPLPAGWEAVREMLDKAVAAQDLPAIRAARTAAEVLLILQRVERS